MDENELRNMRTGIKKIILDGIHYQTPKEVERWIIRHPKFQQSINKLIDEHHSCVNTQEEILQVWQESTNIIYDVLRDRPVRRDV
jgi:hypothetical protein